MARTEWGSNSCPLSGHEFERELVRNGWIPATQAVHVALTCNTTLVLP